MAKIHNRFIRFLSKTRGRNRKIRPKSKKKQVE
jgi:hypothetical protein